VAAKGQDRTRESNIVIRSNRVTYGAFLWREADASQHKGRNSQTQKNHNDSFVWCKPALERSPLAFVERGTAENRNGGAGGEDLMLALFRPASDKGVFS
jgi:hypothetical protein